MFSINQKNISSFSSYLFASCLKNSMISFVTLLPCKHFLFSTRHLEDFFSITIFNFPRHIGMLARRLIQDIFNKTTCNYALKTFWRRLGIKKVLHWRYLQDVFKTPSVRPHQDKCLLGIFYYLNYGFHTFTYSF